MQLIAPCMRVKGSEPNVRGAAYGADRGRLEREKPRAEHMR